MNYRGTPRTTISAYLRLLGLDEEVRAEALNLSDEDERVARFTEPRLRHLVGPQRGCSACSKKIWPVKKIWQVLNEVSRRPRRSMMMPLKQ